MDDTVTGAGAAPVVDDVPEVAAAGDIPVEYVASSRDGWPIAGALLAAGVGSLGLLLFAIIGPSVLALAAGLVVALGALVLGFGLVPVNPGEHLVVQLLGRYRGTLREQGLRWVNPLTSRRRISMRIRNHETGVAKVNDAEGNPLEIAAVVVWRVEDTAKAVFAIDDFVDFVSIQTETAVRHIASRFPYDAREKGQLSLLDNPDDIMHMLCEEIEARVSGAGVKILESRLTQLSYAPEIAGAMLRRQQATAVVAAREQLVAGAVGMVQMALSRLAEEDVVELDEERKATMVSNLMVVLCGDREAQPVVNTGSLYG
ncbi:MAG: SPFH domain-containing protein [Nocardioides sp.]